jgi:hypothetical protein
MIRSAVSRRVVKKQNRKSGNRRGANERVGKGRKKRKDTERTISWAEIRKFLRHL